KGGEATAGRSLGAPLSTGLPLLDAGRAGRAALDVIAEGRVFPVDADQAIRIMAPAHQGPADESVAAGDDDLRLHASMTAYPGGPLRSASQWRPAGAGRA